MVRRAFGVGGWRSVADANREFLELVLNAVRETDSAGLLHDRRDAGLSGISGLKTVGALQRLVRLFAGDETACYLEIGVFQGLTLVSSALEAPALPCFGVDNFRILDPNGENLGIVQNRINSFRAENATLLNMDFEDALENLDVHTGGRKVGVYFVDGPHDYRSQMVCLLGAKRHLAERAVIVIDDANYGDVRMATRDFLLSHGEFKMVFEGYSPAHPANLDADARAKWEAGWLNGVNILVRDPDGLLPPMLPPVDGDRSVFFNEWLVHRLRLARLAPEAVALADAVATGDGEAEARQNLLARHGEEAEAVSGLFADRNTGSGGLTEGRFNMLP